jgi:biotin carboxylase
MIGGNRSTIGTIKALRAQGFQVAVAEKLPRQDAFAAADKGYEVAATDLVGLRAAIQDWGGVDGIVGINEAAMTSAASLQAELGLPGLPPEVIRRTASKLAQREAWAKDPLLAVPFQTVASVQELAQAAARIGYPVIVKPDLSQGGSRGVSLAHDQGEIEAAFAFAQAHGLEGSQVIVECALDGPQFSAELVTCNDFTRVLAIGRKIKSAIPYRVDLAISYPGVIDENTITAISRMAAAACARLGITHGPGHIEFAVTPDGPRPIELGARCGGSLTADLAAHVSGYHPMVEAAKLACGLPTDGWSNVQSRGAVLMFLAYPPGKAKALHMPESVLQDPAVLDATARLPDSGMIEPVQWTSQRVGYLGVVGDNGPATLQHALTLAAQIKVESENGTFHVPLTVETKAS